MVDQTAKTNQNVVNASCPAISMQIAARKRVILPKVGNHKEIAIIASTNGLNMSFNNSGIFNHMRSHSDWFLKSWTPKWLDNMDPSDANMHPICHIGDVSFSNNGEHQKCIKISSMFPLFQRTWPQFNTHVCFIKDLKQVLIGRTQKNRRPIPHLHDLGEYFVTVGDPWHAGLLSMLLFHFSLSSSPFPSPIVTIK